MTGHRDGAEGDPRLGIGAFVAQDGGSTTLAAAVAMLVSLALVFSLANAQWISSRAADVQAVADAGALACVNTLSSYVTAAQVLDSIVLSLGLVGMLTMAIGLVVSAIPIINAAGPPIVDAGTKVLEARASLSKSAARGLEKLEGVLPYVMSANSLLAVRSNATTDGSYAGVAVPFPSEGSTDFGSLLSDDVAEKGAGASESGERLEELTGQADAAKQAADEALKRGWEADCGSEPSCMWERAATLAGLSGAENPWYPDVEGWGFEVPLERARAYYRARLASESPGDASARELARSCARRAFYEYALEQVEASSVTRGEDGSVTCDLAELPANTQDVRGTRLYTDAVWPCTVQDGIMTIHCSLACSGATGSPAGSASLAQEEGGVVARCPVCQFDVVDVGRAPAASTNIENGFEHHWREVARAGAEYQERLQEQLEKEEAARGEAEKSRDLFSEALSALGTVRVRLDPPGKYGCVCVVADARSHAAPSQLVAFAGEGGQLPAGVSVAGAGLAPDVSEDGSNVLAHFFDGMVAQGGVIGGAGGVLDAVMGAWGGLLASYGDGYEAFMAGANDMFAKLTQIGLGRVSTWLKDALSSVIELTALEPADLTPRKPVLVNTHSVMDAAGYDFYATLSQFAANAETFRDAGDPEPLLSALGVYLRQRLSEVKLTIAEIPVPGTDRTIPVEVDFGWLMDRLAA